MSQLSEDARNQLLIKLGNFKWSGEGRTGLLTMVRTALKQNPNYFKNHADHTNIDQIHFAKLVWNCGKKGSRAYLLETPNAEFMALCKDERMTPLLVAALDRFLAAVRGGGNPGKEADFHDICAKYAILKAKQSNEGPFTEQLTDAEKAFILKFEARKPEVIELHKPNQNAVTYVYLLGLLFHVTGIMNLKNLDIDAMQDMLHFIALHGQKGFQKFRGTVQKYTSIPGVKSQVDLRPHFDELLNSDKLVTAISKSEANKFVANKFLTLKRMVRMVHIFTKHSTPWGMLSRTTGDVIDDLIEMHTLETQVQSPDMISLAIIWYHCINRSQLSTVMVDHHEKSAGSVLAVLVGKQPKADLEPPDHVFPLHANINKSFDFEASV
jgi:hypothetical protein